MIENVSSLPPSKKLPMDLSFRISRDDVLHLVEEELAREIARYNRHVNLISELTSYRRHRRIIFSIIFLVPIFLRGLVYFLQFRGGASFSFLNSIGRLFEFQNTLEHWIRLSVECAFLWLINLRYGQSFITRLAAVQERFAEWIKPFSRMVISVFLYRIIFWRLIKAEGVYHFHIDEVMLSMRGPQSHRVTKVPWSKVVSVVEAGRFYTISTRASQRFGLAYLVAKESDEMDSQAYQAALRQFLIWSSVKINSVSPEAGDK